MLNLYKSLLAFLFFLVAGGLYAQPADTLFIKQWYTTQKMIKSADNACTLVKKHKYRIGRKKVKFRYSPPGKNKSARHMVKIKV